MRRALAAVIIGAAVSSAAPARAQTCTNVVIVGLAGVTWSDVERVEPPQILELAEGGAVGSVAVRTNTSRTTYGAGFATLGAGARMDAPKSVGPVRPPDDLVDPDDVVRTGLRVAGLDAMRELAREAGYSTARPGALAESLPDHPVIAVGSSVLGFDPPAPLGVDLPVLLAAMDEDGALDGAAVGPDLLEPDGGAPFGVRTDTAAVGEVVRKTLGDPCAVLVLDPGDLVRADVVARLGDDGGRDAALLSADRQIESVVDALDDDDLLLVVSVTSPRSDDDTHLGVAIARGPGFEPGGRLESASTREPGLVTLPDVAPTVLAHLGVERPSSMLGRPWFARPASGDLVAEAVDLDEESVFSYGVQPGVATGFVVAQVAAYVGLLALFALRRRGRAIPEGVPARGLEVVALSVAAFPLASYLAMVGMTHELGTAGFVALLLAVDAVIVGLGFAALGSPLDRLLGIAAATLLIMVGDLVIGERLQLNAVFGNSPIVAGRFSGLGNLAFSILGASAVVVATVLVHRSGRSGRALLGAAVIFALAVVVDGAPFLGSDVGGVLALVPGFAITWFLLSGRRVAFRAVLVAGLGGVVALGLFLALDLARPEESRTHLARLVENVADEGPDVFVDTIERKVKTNARIFGSTIWTYLVPPALLLLAVLLRKPPGRWQQLATAFPIVRSGLVGGLALALLGFAVNDSGIVVPAMFLSWLVPMALVAYVSLEKAEGVG